MGWFDRLILMMYTLVVACLSVMVAGVALHYISLELIETSLSYIYGRWEAVAVAAVFLLVSLRLLFASFRRYSTDEASVNVGQLGDVRVSLHAIRQLVEKVVLQFKEVREVHPKIMVEQDGLHIILRVAVNTETYIPAISENIQNNVKEYVSDKVGATISTIQVIVESISNEAGSRSRPRVQ